MKKGLIILFTLASLAACTTTPEKEIDGAAGASLNRADTINQYEELKAKVDAVANNPNATPEEFEAAQKEIREFQKYLEEYRASASPGAKKYLEEFTGDLERHDIFDSDRGRER